LTDAFCVFFSSFYLRTPSKYDAHTHIAVEKVKHLLAFKNPARVIRPLHAVVEAKLLLSAQFVGFSKQGSKVKKLI
jgi:hypothetical protein